MAVAAPPVECRALTKHYGTTVGIADLDLVVERGTVTGFLGPNGAGKTTVIRVLAGLLKPTSGSAALFGTPVDHPEARAALGYLPADPAFYPQLTGSQNLDLLGELGGWLCPDRGWAAGLLGLPDEALGRPVGGYSSGMVQKLGLVQAFQHRPELVILDEPANRLDPIAHHRFEQLVRETAADGRTVLLSSHILSEVEAVCDTVAMVRGGRLLTTADVAEVAAAAQRNITIRYRRRPTPPAFLADAVVDGHVVRGRLPANRPELVAELAGADGVEDLIVEPASLEDVFLHLYEGDGP